MCGRYRDLLTDFIAGGWGAHGGRARRGWPMMHAGRQVLVMADAVERPGAVLMVHDPDRATRPLTQLLRDLYDLTAREAQVAALIGAGEDVDRISRRLGLRRASASW